MQYSENFGALILTNLGKISQTTNLMFNGYRSFCVIEENMSVAGINTTNTSVSVCSKPYSVGRSKLEPEDKMAGCYRVLQSVTKCCKVLQIIKEYCRVLQGITEYYRVLQSITEYGRVWQSIAEY